MTIEEKFQEIIESDEDYKKSLEIVRENAKDKIWLIGSAVYGNLLRIEHGLNYRPGDYDFIIESFVGDDKIVVPSDWVLTKNSFGTYKFSNGELKFDFIPLDRTHYIKINGLEPRIENFLNGAVPFTLQRAAYYCNEKKLLDKGALDAIKNKKLEIFNQEEMIIYCAMKKINPESFIDNFAEKFGLKK